MAYMAGWSLRVENVRDEGNGTGDEQWQLMTTMNFTIMKALNIKEFNSMIVDDKGNSLE